MKLQEKKNEKTDLFLFFSLKFDIIESENSKSRCSHPYYNTFFQKEEEMFSFLTDFLHKKGIFLISRVAISDCILQKPYLLERAGLQNGTVVIFAVPYLSQQAWESRRNISAYAAARDYHRFFQALGEELLPLLTRRYPNHRFALFADHSPINEVDAAAKAGLGVIGKNRLLITREHSSYVFLGSLITNADLSAPTAAEPAHCENCGRCSIACPAGTPSRCLSALTQKKGILSQEEEALLIKGGSIWGCDRCQECCPHTEIARKNGTLFSNIPYFNEHLIPYLSEETLASLTEEEFSARAYAWRGKSVVERNLKLQKKEEDPC